MGLFRVLGVWKRNPGLCQRSKFDFAGRPHSPAYSRLPARFLLDFVSHLSRETCKGDACFGCCRHRHQGRAAQRHLRWAARDFIGSTKLHLHRAPFCIVK